LELLKLYGEIFNEEAPNHVYRRRLGYERFKIEVKEEGKSYYLLKQGITFFV
jgi:hypothetical protein